MSSFIVEIDHHKMSKKEFKEHVRNEFLTLHMETEKLSPGDKGFKELHLKLYGLAVVLNELGVDYDE